MEDGENVTEVEINLYTTVHSGVPILTVIVSAHVFSLALVIIITVSFTNIARSILGAAVPVSCWFAQFPLLAAVHPVVPCFTVVVSTHEGSSTLLISVTVSISQSTGRGGSAAVPVIESSETHPSLAAVQFIVPTLTVVVTTHEGSSTLVISVTVSLSQSTGGSLAA